MNFNAISKNVKILKIGLVELKLWKKITNCTELINSVYFANYTELINSVYRIRAIINRGYYFFEVTFLAGYNSRAVINQERLQL